MKRCSKKECCKQCRYFKVKGTTTKWPVQKPTHRTTQKHAEHHDATDIQKTTIFVFLDFFNFLFFKFILREMVTRWCRYCDSEPFICCHRGDMITHRSTSMLLCLQLYTCFKTTCSGFWQWTLTYKIKHFYLVFLFE